MGTLVPGETIDACVTDHLTGTCVPSPNVHVLSARKAWDMVGNEFVELVDHVDSRFLKFLGDGVDKAMAEHEKLVMLRQRAKDKNKLTYGPIPKPSASHGRPTTTTTTAPAP